MWDDKYAQDKYVYGKLPNDFLREQYHQVPKGGRVLCLAEGEGRNAVYLAQKGYEVTAVDQSGVGLKKAKQLAFEAGVVINTVVADLNDYQVNQQQWDGIISIFAHVPPELRRRLHRDVVEALSPCGAFILEAYTPKQLTTQGVGGPPPSQDDKFMTLQELKTELRPLNFTIAQEVVREIYEGEHHQGESAVVQIVAKL